MTIKEKIFLSVGALTGLIGNALAADNLTVSSGNLSLTPDSNRGMENLQSLPYVDKFVWMMDTVSALVPLVAVLAIGILAIKYYSGGWDSVENEIKSKKKFFGIIGIVLIYKVGIALIGFLNAW